MRLEGPSQIGLFAYDNNGFIVESFAAPGGIPVNASVLVDKKYTRLLDLVSGQTLTGQTRAGRTAFDLTLAPATYRVLMPQ